MSRGTGGSVGSVGSVAQLWRFPVKSMQGERCASLELTDGGFLRDRTWAVVDRATGRTLTGKRVAELLLASARLDGETVIVTLPDGSEHDASDPEASAAVASWLDRDCALVPAGRAGETSYDMSFDPLRPDDDLVDIPISAGAFFDLTPVHLLTTGSLATMAASYPNGAWDVRRFRPNVLIETGADEVVVQVGPNAPVEAVEPGTAHPSYPEDGWIGSMVRLGSDAAVAPVLPTLRCVMPTRRQAGLDRDLDIHRTMQSLHANHLGVYAEPRATGTISEGDRVVLEPAGAP